MTRPTRRLAVLAIAAALAWPGAAAFAREPRHDPLPSWNPGPAKQAILGFVARTTRPGPDFVPPPERIAVFDNDGTLWIEQPIYTQFVFAIDRVGELVAKDPTLREKPAFRAAADKDITALARLDEKSMMELAVATQAGLTPDAYRAVVRAWLASARHTRFDVPYTQLIYEPQRELLSYLRSAGYRTYIVSGGGDEFMRTFAEAAYGVPPEQVIGTSQKATFADAEVTFQPQLNSLDDGPGKPVNIALQIGRRPVIAVGNSDGDQAMLQYTAARKGPSLVILVHHDDAQREYAYDRASQVGRLDKALDEAGQRNWTVVSMKADWATIFPKVGARQGSASAAP